MSIFSTSRRTTCLTSTTTISTLRRSCNDKATKAVTRAGTRTVLRNGLKISRKKTRKVKISTKVACKPSNGSSASRGKLCLSRRSNVSQSQRRLGASLRRPTGNILRL